MKKFNLFFIFLALACALRAQPYEPYSSEFYQDFITAAWHERHGNSAEAFTYYEKLNQIVPDDASILKSLASIAVARDDKPAMEKYIPQLIKLLPNDADAIAANAALLWSQGHVASARKEYERAIKIAPDNPEIISRYVSLLTAADSDKAISYLQTLAAEYPPMAGGISLHVADIYLKQNKPDAAIAYLKEAIKRYPSYPEIYIGLIKIYEMRGDTASVLKQYLAMERAGLADSDILTKIGAYYVLENKKDLSHKYFLKAKELDSGNPAAAQFLTLNAQERGDFKQAIIYLQDSRDYNKNPANHIRVSYFYNRLGDLRAAAQTLADAYEKFGKNVEVGLYYGLALEDLQDYKNAQKIFKEVLASVPKNEMALFHYAFVSERLKNYGEMEKALKKLLEVNPANHDALNFYGYYLVDKTKRLDEGGALIKKAVSIKPDEPAFIDSLAWYYYKKGDLQQARGLLESIKQETAVKDAEILLHSAMVYEALKEYPLAEKYYRLTLEADPKNKPAQKGLKNVTKKSR